MPASGYGRPRCYTGRWEVLSYPPSSSRRMHSHSSPDDNDLRMPTFRLFRVLGRWLPPLLVLGLVLGVGWIGLIWSPAQEAATVRPQRVDRREGAALAQACLDHMRQRYGNTPVLSHIEAQSWTWTGPQSDGNRFWTLDGTLRYGDQLAAFDCDGVQSAAGVLKVHSASGTPWWTPPPG